LPGWVIRRKVGGYPWAEIGSPEMTVPPIGMRRQG
jgi:hypothetical protein